MNIYFGLIAKGKFHQIIINEKPLEFFENLRPMIAREPMQLLFRDSDEGSFVFVKEEVSGDGTKPIVYERFGKLPEKLINTLINQGDYSLPLNFSTGKIGGSVNWIKPSE